MITINLLKKKVFNFKETRICVLCKKEFLMHNAKSRQCLECYAEVGKCETCGQKIRKYSRPGKIKRFCCRSCCSVYTYYYGGLKEKFRNFTPERIEALTKHIISVAKSRIGKPSKLRGELCWNWKGGHASRNRSERQVFSQTYAYKEWRRSVFKRDNFCCVICGKHTRTLEVDHIKPYSLFPELRLDIDNGRTLCKECHRETDTFGGKINKFKREDFVPGEINGN